MKILYAQKSSPVQKAADTKAASVLDSSAQSESLQRKADMANNAAQRAEAPRPNNTGMPDNLKAGIESLSGYSMDDVRVHYNSSKPAAVQALAYTQGTDIHVAPGQEKCLPHEAWHVAQQMAGRVSPTTNINGMPVNDNAALEHEADVKGEKAIQCKHNEFLKKKNVSFGALQLVCKIINTNEPSFQTKSLLNLNSSLNGTEIVLFETLCNLNTDAYGYIQLHDRNEKHLYNKTYFFTTLCKKLKPDLKVKNLKNALDYIKSGEYNLNFSLQGCANLDNVVDKLKSQKKEQIKEQDDGTKEVVNSEQNDNYKELLNVVRSEEGKNVIEIEMKGEKINSKIDALREIAKSAAGIGNKIAESAAKNEKGINDFVVITTKYNDDQGLSRMSVVYDFRQKTNENDDKMDHVDGYVVGVQDGKKIMLMEKAQNSKEPYLSDCGNLKNFSIYPQKHDKEFVLDERNLKKNRGDLYTIYSAEGARFACVRELNVLNKKTFFYYKKHYDGKETIVGVKFTDLWNMWGKPFEFKWDIGNAVVIEKMEGISTAEKKEYDSFDDAKKRGGFDEEYLYCIGEVFVSGDKKEIKSNNELVKNENISDFKNNS